MPLLYKTSHLTRLFTAIPFSERVTLIDDLLDTLPRDDQWDEALRDFQSILESDASEAEMMERVSILSEKLPLEFAETTASFAIRAIAALVGVWFVKDQGLIYQHFDWFPDFSYQIGREPEETDDAILEAFDRAGLERPPD